MHVAQLNVATLRHRIDEPESTDFANALAPVNAAGEVAPGFVWRLQTDSGDATSIQAFPNPLTIVNLTDEAKERLEFFDRIGPSPYAFEFGQQFPQIAITRSELLNYQR